MSTVTETAQPRPDETQAPRGALVGSVVTVAGGVLLILSIFVSWLQVSARRIGPRIGSGFPNVPTRPFPQSRTISADGWRLVSGKVALAMGLVLVAAGLVIWLSANLSVRRAFAIVAVIAGTVGASFVAARMGSVINQADVAARARFVRTTRTLEPGAYIALLGGLAGVAGGIVVLGTLPLMTVPWRPGPSRPGWPAPPVPSGPPPTDEAARYPLQDPHSQTEPEAGDEPTVTIPSPEATTELPRATASEPIR